MPITQDTFVTITTGYTWVGYTDGREVAARITKKGKLPRNAGHDRLYSWYSFNGKQDINRTRIARYDAATEELAKPVRQRIQELRQQLRDTQTELEALYDYQAGPMPE